jgi:hypothetical protein
MRLNLPQALASLLLAAEMFARRANFRQLRAEFLGLLGGPGFSPAGTMF